MITITEEQYQKMLKDLSPQLVDQICEKIYYPHVSYNDKNFPITNTRLFVSKALAKCAMLGIKDDDDCISFSMLCFYLGLDFSSDEYFQRIMQQDSYVIEFDLSSKFQLTMQRFHNYRDSICGNSIGKIIGYQGQIGDLITNALNKADDLLTSLPEKNSSNINIVEILRRIYPQKAQYLRDSEFKEILSKTVKEYPAYDYLRISIISMYQFIFNTNSQNDPRHYEFYELMKNAGSFSKEDFLLEVHNILMDRRF